MNVDFLKKEGVTHIVNTAKGMEVFGPKYTVSSWALSTKIDDECVFFDFVTSLISN